MALSDYEKTALEEIARSLERVYPKLASRLGPATVRPRPAVAGDLQRPTGTLVKTMDSILETRNLQKRFGRVKALDGLDLSVAPGEIHGFLGPNGAGKSTTIRILLGLVRASGGSVTVFGHGPWTDAAALHRASPTSRGT